MESAEESIVSDLSSLPTSPSNIFSEGKILDPLLGEKQKKKILENEKNKANIKSVVSVKKIDRERVENPKIEANVVENPKIVPNVVKNPKIVPIEIENPKIVPIVVENPKIVPNVVENPKIVPIKIENPKIVPIEIESLATTRSPQLKAATKSPKTKKNSLPKVEFPENEKQVTNTVEQNEQKTMKPPEKRRKSVKIQATPSPIPPDKSLENKTKNKRKSVYITQNTETNPKSRKKSAPLENQESHKKHLEKFKTHHGW